MKRQDPKDEKRKLLTRRKAKEKVSEEKEQSVSLEISKNPAFYQPADLCKGYPGHHEDRQKFKKDKENMLRLQIKDKQNSLKKMVKEIEEMKRMLEITTRERDQSSDEETCRTYAKALQLPKVAESLGLFTGPKYFIKIKFFPSEFKSYELDCLIDSGFPMNLAKGNAIPSFYWEKNKRTWCSH